MWRFAQKIVLALKKFLIPTYTGKYQAKGQIMRTFFGTNSSRWHNRNRGDVRLLLLWAPKDDAMDRRTDILCDSCSGLRLHYWPCRRLTASPGSNRPLRKDQNCGKQNRIRKPACRDDRRGGEPR